MNVTAESTMGEILSSFPGARRALFSRYHLGGCQSCGFPNDETIASLCVRNGGIPPQEMIDHLVSSHEHDASLLLSPQAVSAMLASPTPPLLMDCRTREEHEAVCIPGSIFLTQESQQKLFSQNPELHIVLYDHQGRNALDTCAWFLGHGMANTRVLQGGIDAWSREVDPSLPRYELEIHH